MARLTAVTRAEIARRQQDAETAARAGVRQTLHAVTQRFTNVVTVDDLGSLLGEWAKHVDAVLLDHVDSAYWHGVDTAQRAVVAALDARRTAVSAGLPNDSGSSAPADLAAANVTYSLTRVPQTVAEQFLANARNRLVNAGNDVWETIRAELLTGLQAGESIALLQARIMSVTDFAAARAVLVARSEIGAASNTGSRTQMQALGLPSMTKQWIATDDDRTRPEHAEVDGEVVALDDTFSLGEDPGDDYNCRCTTGYDLPDDQLDTLATSADDSLTAGAHATVPASGGAGMTTTLEVTADAETATSAAAPVTEPAVELVTASAATTVPCANCGAMNDADALYCDQCGAKMDDNDVSDTTSATEPLGGKPSQGTAADKRLKRNRDQARHTPNSEATVTALQDQPVDEALANEPPMWRGPLVVEGSATGDGREFAPDAIQWADPPMPLRWQKEDSHGGAPTNVTVTVGLINKVWRDGSNIMGEGVFDLGGPADDDAHEAYRRMGAGMLSGVSIDADDITNADIEYVFPDAEGETEEDDLLMLLFATPEKVIFHSARIRAATLCDIPAFVEAQLHLIPDDERQAALVASALAAEQMFGAVASHSTATSDGSWDGPANEARLASPLSVAAARQAYAWLDDGAVEDGEIPKSGCKFIHHEVNGDGTPGAANLTACSTGIGVLHGGRGGTTIPSGDQRGVYNHLAKHLRDGGQEPPPFEDGSDASGTTLLAGASFDAPWQPPRAWFQDPQLGQVMPIMVNDQGRVYGHAAQWGQCHLGYLNECVMPPFEEYHDHYLTGEVTCDDGSRVAVGQITAGIEHARLTMTASQAKDHYENTDAVVADVVIGNDKHGIWVAGAVRPWAHASRAYALRASGQVSPDWRRIGGTLRLVALLTVNTSGYQTARARSFVAGGDIQSLVSSGMVVVSRQGVTDEDLDRRALERMREQLANRVHGITTEV